jgi:EmrB/QacA subfamily drug resistance transporter
MAPNRAGAPRWGLPLLTVMIGAFVSVLSTSVINIAVPAIQKAFNATTDDVQWISTAYLLGLGAALPASAWLDDRLGLRRAYLWSLSLFTLITTLCGLAPDLEILTVLRVLQAFPGAVLPVAALTILYRLVPREKLGTATSLFGMGLIVGPGAGPTIGGLLVQYTDWRMTFLLTIPFGLLGIVLGRLALPAMPGRTGRAFDWPAFLCLSVGLFAMLLAFDKGQAWGWTSYSVLVSLCVGLDLVVLFVAIELRTADPLLDVRVFTCRPFTVSVTLIAILAVELFSALSYVPLFLVGGQQVTPELAGLVLLPQALTLVVMMPIAGRVYDRVGPRRPALVGLALTAAGTLPLTGLSIATTRPELVLWTVVRAVGIGLAIIPVLTGGLSALAAEVADVGSAFNIMTQRVAASLGLALLSALATAQQAQLTSDRLALLPRGGPYVDPDAELAPVPGRQLLLQELTQRDLQAHAYRPVFLVVGVLAVLAIPVAALLPSGGPKPVTPGRLSTHGSPRTPTSTGPRWPRWTTRTS